LTAVELDPGSVSALRSLGFSFVYARRYDQARFHFERAITMNPNAEESYRLLGLTLGLAGDYAEAERVLREVIDLPPCECNYTYATLGYVLGLAGRKAEARTILAELERQRERDYVSPVGLAMIELGLGNLDRALDWTEIAFAERRGWLAYLNVNPVFDPLRGHPRFNDLVRRMKL
jgi:serine/threonine-protein kinase